MNVRPNVAAMTGYVPGEQPRGGPVLKLNTNESPYPPSPRVIEALRAALTDDALRKYPDATAADFRSAAAAVHGVPPEQVIAGNGSDDILTILVRAFVPEGGVIASPTPSYTLYRNLAEIQAAEFRTAPFTEDWKLPDPWPHADADLTFLANPNSPSGTRLGVDEVARLLAQLRGPLVLDEAYVDFAEADGIDLVATGRVIVTRTLSKSYALAGLRFGYGVASPQIIGELMKVKDSYNCDVLSQVAATAAVADRGYLRETVRKMNATRERMRSTLMEMGFDVTPSEANFLWCRRTAPVRPVYESLREQGILIRYMSYPEYGEGLRISVGTDGEVDKLFSELCGLL